MNYTSQCPCSVPPPLEARLVLLNQQNVAEVILFQCQAKVLRRHNSSCFGGFRNPRCDVRCRAPCEKAIQRVRNPASVKRDPVSLASGLSSAPNRSARWMQPQSEWPLARPEETSNWAQTGLKNCEQIKWLLFETVSLRWSFNAATERKKKKKHCSVNSC